MDTAAAAISTIDTADLAGFMPAGFWIATSLANGKLEWGAEGAVWGDTIAADELHELVNDCREAAGLSAVSWEDVGVADPVVDLTPSEWLRMAAAR